MKNIIKNTSFKFGLIMGLFITSVLIVLPRTPINLSIAGYELNTFVGGYELNLFGGRYYVDLTDYKMGLDIAGGTRIVLQADMSAIDAQNRESALEAARSIIERRVNFLGVSEAVVRTSRSSDSYRIVAEIPGLENSSEAISLIGQTAQLQFKELKPELEWSPEKFAQYYSDPTAWQNTEISGSDILGAEVLFSAPGAGDLTAQNQPQVQLRFSSEGREKFIQVATQNVGKPIAIYLDDDQFPLSAPIVSEGLAQNFTGDPVITGNFDIESARNLSIQIRAGALPIPVKIIEQQQLGATLGQAAVSQSYQAGLIGLFIILLFMVLFYGKLGLIADFALVIYIFLVLAIFKLVPVVLTVPGIAGFLLSIGVAIDANILIFERVLEELRAKRPRSLAIKMGFDHAWSSIRDASVSSLLTAFILFYLGSGQVRGFALTFIIGILVSLFTAVVVVRNFFEFFGISKNVTGHTQSILKKLFVFRRAR